MILTCPACSTRYETDAAKFAPEGRKVRCAKCGHVWHQAGPETVMPAAAPVPAPEAVAPEVTPPVAAPAAVPERVVVESRGVSPAWRVGALTGWAALIALVAVLCWGAVTFRQEVVSLFPRTASAYALLGMKVNSVGLAFQDVSYRVTSESDMPVLYIRGRIVNITQRELQVPQIQAALRDAARRELYDWTIDPRVKTLAPGKSAEFSARLTSPPMGARQVDLRFVKGGA